MPRTGGAETKKRILKVAEKLFSENGFDATSVDKIAKTAKVNKALIYYHFKNKNDIAVSMFKNIIDELTHGVGSSLEDFHQNKSIPKEKKIKTEVELLKKKKGILSVLLMEGMKNKDKNNFLFQIAEIVIHNEKNTKINKLDSKKEKKQYNSILIHEFFTGFLPMVMFVVLNDKWNKHYSVNAEDSLDNFVDSFVRSHINSH